MFGRATIRLGIGPHSSFYFCHVFLRVLTFFYFWENVFPLWGRPSQLLLSSCFYIYAADKIKRFQLTELLGHAYVISV